MKPLLFDVKSLLTNSVYFKEIKSKQLNDQFHFHNAYEIALILKGSGRRIVGDCVETFKSGDIVILGPEIAHASYSDKKYHVKGTKNIHAIVVYFEPNWISDSVLSSADFESFKILLNNLKRGIVPTGELKGFIKNQVIKLRNADGFKALIILLEILYFLSETDEYTYLVSSGYINSHKENDVQKIDEIYKYVMKNFTGKISLNNVSERIFMTPSAFCKYFKSKTNKTFTQFVNEIRINYACDLLRSNDNEIYNICFQCGFNNFTSFNKFFKQFMQLTPTEYRLRFRTAFQA